MKKKVWKKKFEKKVLKKVWEKKFLKKVWKKRLKKKVWKMWAPTKHFSGLVKERSRDTYLFTNFWNIVWRRRRSILTIFALPVLPLKVLSFKMRFCRSRPLLVLRRVSKFPSYAEHHIWWNRKYSRIIILERFSDVIYIPSGSGYCL